MISYGGIYKNFLIETGITPDMVNDYRPATRPYIEIDIPYAIVVWLKSRNQIIYRITDAEKKEKQGNPKWAEDLLRKFEESD